LKKLDFKFDTDRRLSAFPYNIYPSEKNKFSLHREGILKRIGDYSTIYEALDAANKHYNKKEKFNS
jgi:hypothetical protein